MSGTAIRGVLTGLTAVFATSAPGGWEVLGRRPFDPQSTKFLAVGWGGSETNPAVQVPTRLSVNAWGDQVQETVNVLCMLSLWSGTDSVDTNEGELVDAFDVFDAALNADLKLGGAAMTARITTFDYLPTRVTEGVLGRIEFIVTAITQK